MPDWKRDFYRFHASLMEPWDGPASIAFTDGTVIGAVLDRNGLRPSRYWVTDDGLVVMASEVGVLPIDQSTVVQKGRLQPGRMFLIDTNLGRIVGDDEIKEALAAQQPYGEWLHAGLVHLDDLPARDFLTPQHASVVKHQRVFGYTTEELKVLLAPMARTGAEPIGSMGTDTPVAVLSDRSRLLFDYFQQLFAQVTNPPLDAIREELVTVDGRHHRTRGQPAAARARRRAGRWCSPTRSSPTTSWPSSSTSTTTTTCRASSPSPSTACSAWPRAATGLRRALDDVRGQGERGHRRRRQGHHPQRPLLERRAGADPVAAAHRGGAPPPDPREGPHPGRPRRRVRRRPRGAPHGAAARLRRRRHQPLPRLRDDRGHDRPGRDHRPHQAPGGEELRQGQHQGRAEDHVEDGHLHRRVATRAPRCSRRSACPRSWSTSTSPAPPAASAASASTCSPRRWPPATGSPTSTAPRRLAHRDLWAGGEYQWRREGEHHLFNPETVFKLQHATRTKRYDIFKEYTTRVDDQARKLATLRGLFQLQGRRAPAGADRRGRAGERDRQAVLHRRHELRLDLDGGARDARHRHEPHRRQVEHRRGRRGRRAALRPASGAAPSSRWRRAASA